MGYVHCMPARVVQLSHGTDNVIRGVLRMGDEERLFSTRGHVVKATNRIYRNAGWKPSAGDDVIVDGEFGPIDVIVDHIEPDLDEGDACVHEHLDALAPLLAGHPAASATLRVWRRSTPFRLRFAKPVTGEGKRGVRRPGILHGSYDPATGLWRVWTVAQEGGALAVRGVDRHALPAIASELGISIDPPVVGDRGDDERPVRPSKRVHVYEDPPFDDVPF